MANEHILAAIKAGMKGEIDSTTVYETAAITATRENAPEVRDFFAERAEEEKKHYNWLLAYYKEIAAGGQPGADFALGSAPVTSPIISQDFLRRVGESRQLSAALSTAILLEATAVKHYLNCAEEAVQAPLRSFYETLSAWEDRHYHDLISIQEESERYFWDANNWQPF
ncbi:MAG TPA: ferritin family protein [Rectinemataceae bacterium]|nr:ferritin family protein [Rectinemataceae bacterium]